MIRNGFAADAGTDKKPHPREAFAGQVPFLPRQFGKDPNAIVLACRPLSDL